MARLSRDDDRNRLFGWTDLFVAGITLSTVMAVVLGVGAGMQSRVDETERALRQAMRTNRDLRASVDQMEADRGRNAQIRQMVDGTLLDAERRTVARWAPVLADLSRTRPKSVWLNRVSLQGTKVRVEAQGGELALAQAYVGRLLQSSYLDYVAPAALSDAVTNPGFVIVGRKVGS